jgi:hypothetical protein
VQVVKNRVLRKIPGCVRDKVTKKWRRLHNKGLHNLYYLPVITRVIKSRTLRQQVHVTCTGERRGAYRDLAEKSEGKT